MSGAPARIPNDAAFRGMWADGVKLAEIAAIYGTAIPTVSLAARRYGLPPRQCCTRSAAVPGPEPRPGSPPYRPPHPFFTVYHDARILRTEGRHAGIAALAEEWRQPMQRVRQRWHQLEAG